MGLQWNLKSARSFPEIVYDLCRDDCTSISYSESLSHSLGKKLSLFLSFILLPYWVLSVTFPTYSPLLFPGNKLSNTANKWIKSHKLFCCSHCAFHSWIVHIHSIPIYRDWSLNWTGEFIHLHLCFQPIFESLSYNHNSGLSNESQFNKFNTAKNFYSNTNLHFLFLKLAIKEY